MKNVIAAALAIVGLILSTSLNETGTPDGINLLGIILLFAAWCVRKIKLSTK